MEVSALKYSGAGLHGRSPLLRLQSDERLIALMRRGNGAAFELLVTRYEARLLAFCRHMLGSREDAEDVMQEVLSSAYNAIIADSRPINVRPWLYRIARNRCLNHLRRAQAIGVDSMDIHLSEHGATTADKVHSREEFRMLVDDIQELPETQRTALVLRELEALSYEQIAEAMETTVSSVKSLLVRARSSLAEASEARLLSCEEVRLELAEQAEGMRKKLNPPVRRHVKTCESCGAFETQIRKTGRALAALMLPFGPLALLRKVLLGPLGHSAGAGSAGAGSAGAGASATGAAGAAGGATAAGAGAGASGATAIGTAGAVGAGSSGGILTAGVGAIATKAAAGLAAAALVTGAAVEADNTTHVTPKPAVAAAPPAAAQAASAGAAKSASAGSAVAAPIGISPRAKRHQRAAQSSKAAAATTTAATTTTTTTGATNVTTTLPTVTPPATTQTTPTATTPTATTDVAGASPTTSGGASVTQTTTTPTGTSTTPSDTTTTSTGTTTTPTGTTTTPTGTSTTPTGTGTAPTGTTPTAPATSSP